MKSIILIVFAFYFSGCAVKNNTALKKKEAINVFPGFERVTVMDKRNLDGCGFLLQLADSTFINPVNLPDTLRKDGTGLYIKYHFLPGQMSTCMVGKIIRLDDIKRMQK